MPVATDKEQALLWQKPQGYPPDTPLGSPSIVAGSPVCGLTDISGSVSPVSSHHSSSDGVSSVFFDTHSPPLLNLSPGNLSPSSESQQTHSPAGYDLRESTRRQSLLHQYQHSMADHSSLQASQSQMYSALITERMERFNDEAEKRYRSDSPSRKRAKLANTADQSRTPSPSRSLDSASVARRRSAMQSRRVSSDRNNTARIGRRSPTTRRRSVRERHNPQNRDSSPDRRAFQPPQAVHQIHPAAMFSHHTTHPHHHGNTLHHQAPHHQVSQPVSISPYAIPVCTGPHGIAGGIPVCTAGNIPVCSTAPTWSFQTPGCTVQFPACSIPACSLQTIQHIQNIPFAHHPAIIHHPPIMPHAPPHPHLAPPPASQPRPQHAVPGHPQFIHHGPVISHHSAGEIQLIHETRPPVYHHYHIPQQQYASAIHAPGPTHNPPVLLQEPVVQSNPQDVMGPYARHFAHRAVNRSSPRWRAAIPPPPPPYPGFLLHFLAMLGNRPGVPPFDVDLHGDEPVEVENYEALLNLAERLGDAKPRGLTKADIAKLPTYSFNKDGRQSGSDQASCVVCMCDFENRQQLRVLPCSHEFHIRCVDKWLKSNRTCPICRADSSQGITQTD